MTVANMTNQEVIKDGIDKLAGDCENFRTETSASDEEVIQYAHKMMDSLELDFVKAGLNTDFTKIFREALIIRISE